MYYFLETYEFNNSLYCLHYEYMFFLQYTEKIKFTTVDIILTAE